MRKKISVVLLFMLVVLTVVGCGNMGIGIGNYEYGKVHVDTYHYSGCFTIEKWYDNETGGIEVNTKEAGSMFLSEGQYILLEDKCPFCDTEE